jgi:CubicO group peptidase (beta-lactamase class C family)
MRQRSLIGMGEVAVALLSFWVLSLLLACSDGGCPTCIAGVDPDQLIDPSTLGDGSGYPDAVWTVAPDPRALGWSEKRLKSVSDYARDLRSDGLMVVDRGVVVWEHGNISRNLIVQSCRKSFLSALYGIYHAQGLIDLSATMEELGIDDLPPSLTAVEKQATVEHLLMARSGVYHEAAAESQSMKDARPARGSHAPGTFWYYNNWDFNVLGTLFIQFTGKDVFQALFDDFAVPLRMQEFQPSNGTYYYEEVSEHPAYHFSMSPRDMARFGYLVLRDGRWRGEQIIPADWIERMLIPYSDAGSTWGYSYMWWIGKPEAWGGHTVYAARGGSGQAIFVVDDMDVVITHKVDNRWLGGWSEVYSLVRQILDAKVF